MWPGCVEPWGAAVDSGSFGSHDSGGAGMWARVVSAWTATLVAWETIDWNRLAAMVAFFYTLGLLIEWWWKRAGRPLAESRGWVKKRLRRSSDFGDEHDDDA